MNILLVEDDISIVSFLTEMIQRWSYSVETAQTGTDAIEKVRQKRFDLVLLDIFLPDTHGDKLIPILKAANPDLRIVAMTGYNSRSLERKIRQLGIIYYLTKPVETKTLKRLLDHISKKTA